MSRFATVHLPADRALGDGASQTFLRHLNLCPRSAFLYQKHRGLASTVEMMRGSLGHRAVELATLETIRNGEVAIPPELAKAVLDETIADPEYWVPVEHHDYVREAVYRWAAETAIDPAHVVSVETLFEVDVAGWRVRCRVDFAELADDGARCVVRDYKFGPGAPSLDGIARKRPDGSFAAKAFQLVLYAFVLAHGVPVREEPCRLCEASGVVGPEDFEVECPDCTRGRVEVREPFPVASRAQVFDTEFVFPAIENGDGAMLRRPLSITRSELEAYRPSLEALLSGLTYRVGSGDWPAVVSDEACAICPASAECPIPAEVRDHRGTVNTAEQAADAFEVRQRESKVSAAKTKELRKFVEVHGPVRFGGEMVAEIQPTYSTSIKDKDAFLEAVDRAVQYGEPLERWRYITESHGTRLAVRPLTADELAEGSNE